MKQQSAWDLFCKTGHPLYYTWYCKEKQRQDTSKRANQRDA